MEFPYNSAFCKHGKGLTLTTLARMTNVGRASHMTVLAKQKCARRLVSPGMEEMCQASNQIATFHENQLWPQIFYTHAAARLTCYPLAHLPTPHIKYTLRGACCVQILINGRVHINRKMQSNCISEAM